MPKIVSCTKKPNLSNGYVQEEFKLYVKLETQQRYTCNGFSYSILQYEKYARKMQFSSINYLINKIL